MRIGQQPLLGKLIRWNPTSNGANLLNSGNRHSCRCRIAHIYLSNSIGSPSLVGAVALEVQVIIGTLRGFTLDAVFLGQSVG